jgi:hypothetical protein
MANPHCPSPPPGTTVHCTNQPLAGELYDSCNNALVTILPGSTWHFSTQVSVNPLTRTIVTEQRSNFQNVAGIGSNGNKYQANDTQKGRTAIYPFPLGLSFTIDETRHENQELISLGPLPNQIIHEQVHTVIEVDLSNPFNPTVVVEEDVKGPGLRCRG